ncbi:hypothetical protein CAC42_1896 [Sphaceloma murrayae]|uniref:Uncharacterized protein n=1 Tax=Sphaceloma murrayae TaxID=2082308 RepID=A0A2K1QW29_9PEZI|nr:hypothetical protein CAC42_1896 [Sphaceloma murrayae]
MTLSSRFQHDTVSGYFLQDDPATDAASFDYTKDLGLIVGSSGPTQGNALMPWSRFSQALHHLNQDAASNTVYRLLFLGRHGQGWHNVAEARYGTEAWDNHYSKLDSFDGMRFFDAELTETGRQQARLANHTFAHALAAGLPAPESYTNLREVIGVHTCDKRSTKTAIQARHPSTLFLFEEDFAEDDPLWLSDVRETDEDIDTRIRKFLDDLVDAKPHERVLSLTAHSGAIASILRVVGHRPFALQTGGVLPIVLKTRRIPA